MFKSSGFNHARHLTGVKYGVNGVKYGVGAYVCAPFRQAPKAAKPASQINGTRLKLGAKRAALQGLKAKYLKELR